MPLPFDDLEFRERFFALMGEMEREANAITASLRPDRSLSDQMLDVAAPLDRFHTVRLELISITQHAFRDILTGFNRP